MLAQEGLNVWACSTACRASSLRPTARSLAPQRGQISCCSSKGIRVSAGCLLGDGIGATAPMDDFRMTFCSRRLLTSQLVVHIGIAELTTLVKCIATSRPSVPPPALEFMGQRVCFATFVVGQVSAEYTPVALVDEVVALRDLMWGQHAVSAQQFESIHRLRGSAAQRAVWLRLRVA